VLHVPKSLLLDPFRNWWWFMSTIENLLSVLICSMLWNTELIFELLRGEVVCIVWLVHCVVTYWQSIAFRPALAASRSACLPAREMTHFHMWHACSLSLQWDTAKTTLSQLPQTLYSHLLRWLAAYHVHLTTHLFCETIHTEWKSSCILLGLVWFFSLLYYCAKWGIVITTDEKKVEFKLKLWALSKCSSFTGILFASCVCLSGCLSCFSFWHECIDYLTHFCEIWCESCAIGDFPS